MNILSYVLTPIGAIIAWLLGSFVGHLVTALLFWWAPNSIRFRFAGFLGGLVGVCLAVLTGWWIFEWLCGPNSYSMAAFVASTFPLALTVPGELNKAKFAARSRDELLAGLRESKSESELTVVADMTLTSHKSGAVGTVTGLLATAVWYATT